MQALYHTSGGPLRGLSWKEEEEKTRIRLSANIRSTQPGSALGCNGKTLDVSQLSEVVPTVKNK